MTEKHYTDPTPVLLPGKIPWTEEPDRLQSMGSLRVGHDWQTSLSLFTFMRWRRKWQHSSVLAWRIPGTGEPGGLLSMGSHRVGHDWSHLAAAAATATLYCVNITHFFFPVHQGIWVISTFWLLWIMLLWIFIYGCLHRYTFPFLLSIYLECNFWVI